MIKSFSAKNIRNFNELNIDFSIKKSKRNGEYTNDDDFFKINNDKILKIIGVTGANASGKTTLLEIFSLYKFWIKPNTIIKQAKNRTTKYFIDKELKSLEEKGFNHLEKILKSEKEWMKSNESINRLFEEFTSIFKTKFDINCFINNQPIIYQVEYINKKSEELEHYIEINRNGSIIFKLFNKTTKKMIIENNFDYSTSANAVLDIKNSKMYETFLENVGISYVCISDLFDSNKKSIEKFLNDSNYKNDIDTIIFDYLKNSKNNKIKFIKWLQIADRSIIDVDLKSRFKKNLFSKNNGDKVDLDRLSKGTLKWIFFFFVFFIYKYENTDKIIFIDEIDNYSHIKLVKAILRIISTNKNNIQLVFTTHNTNLFDNTFRHQAIYLIEENHDNNIESYNFQCLSKYNLKKDKLISKLFLDEKIGSHPDGSLILDWIDKYNE